MIIAWILCLAFQNIHAQFKGGSDDGTSFKLATSQSLGENIFNGGSNDGSNSLLAASQSLGESIYTGASNDGSHAAIGLSQALGESIYTGGSDDGSNVKLTTNQILGESIYTGGSNDGSIVITASAASLGESIYAGGSEDGNVSIQKTAASLGESIFAGGSEDGNVSLLSASASLGESIYAGGSEDGSALKEASSQSLAENIYKGGEGMGFAISFKANTPLPIQLLSFGAMWNSKDALVSWETSNELNMQGYTLERSIDQKSFDSIYYIQSNNNLAKTNYSYSDGKLAEKYAHQRIFYYRLKQIELNGHHEYSGIATLVNDLKNQFNLTIFPNPVSDELHLNISGNKVDNIEILLYTLDGKLLKKLTGNLQNTIKISELAAGNYILHVLQNDEKVFSQQISVLK